MCFDNAEEIVRLTRDITTTERQRDTAPIMQNIVIVLSFEAQSRAFNVNEVHKLCKIKITHSQHAFNVYRMGIPS